MLYVVLVGAVGVALAASTFAAAVSREPAWLQLYLATLNTGQVVLLAWIGAEQRASAIERHRRQAAERE